LGREIEGSLKGFGLASFKGQFHQPQDLFLSRSFALTQKNQKVKTPAIFHPLTYRTLVLRHASAPYTMTIVLTE